MLSVSLYSILSVQIVCSVQLNCTDNNYKETECYVERVTAQNIHCTNTVQTVQSVTELYLQ